VNSCQLSSNPSRSRAFAPSWLLLVTLACLGWGCASGPSVKTSFQPGVDFGKYKSFALAHPNHPTAEAGGVNPFMVFRLRQMVYSELARRGYSAVPFDQAELLISVNAQARTRTESMPASHWTPYTYSGPEVRTLETLLLSVDISDSQQSLIWHGSSETLAPEEETDLWTLVQAVVAKFPPTAGDG